MEISDTVQQAIEENKGFVVILAGSNSDQPHIDKVAAALKNYRIPHQARICSAHKQPEALQGLIEDYDFINGALAYIAIADGTDALSGSVSFNSIRPVVSCPPDAPNNTCLTNPPGSSNGYVARPENAARFIAQMFSHLSGTPYAELLREEMKSKIIKLENADKIFSVFPYVPPEVKK